MIVYSWLHVCHLLATVHEGGGSGHAHLLFSRLLQASVMTAGCRVWELVRHPTLSGLCDACLVYSFRLDRGEVLFCIPLMLARRLTNPRPSVPPPLRNVASHPLCLLKLDHPHGSAHPHLFYAAVSWYLCSFLPSLLCHSYCYTQCLLLFPHVFRYLWLLSYWILDLQRECPISLRRVL